MTIVIMKPIVERHRYVYLACSISHVAVLSNGNNKPKYKGYNSNGIILIIVVYCNDIIIL